MAAATAAATVATASPISNGIMHPSSINKAGDKYRGAVVEDMQLPPAFSLPETEVIARAIELAYDRDFSHIPVLSSKGRRPLGYIDVAGLKVKWAAGEAKPEDIVSTHMNKFRRSASHPYTLITPSTPLGELEKFLHNNIFALVTDWDRQFVLALATRADLDNFVTRRGL